jgi:ABC-type sugar transport system ATPase subunit
MDIGGWLRSLGLERYEAAFRENEIDETVLPSLTHETLKEIGVTAVGPGLCFDAVVELVEKLGAEILLDLRVGRHTMVASVEPTVRAQRGEKLRLAMHPERVHFFDAASEKTI